MANKPPKSDELTGSDASGLSYIAEWPDSKNVKEVMDHFSNQHVKNIGLAILGETEGLTQHEIDCGNALRKWAKDKRDALEEETKNKILRIKSQIKDLESQLRFLEGKKK